VMKVLLFICSVTIAFAFVLIYSVSLFLYTLDVSSQIPVDKLTIRYKRFYEIMYY